MAWSRLRRSHTAPVKKFTALKKLHLRLRPCNIARSMTAALNHYLSRVSHLRLPKICVAVTGSDAVDLVEKAEAIVRDNTFIEFRLDYLSRPGLAIQKLKEFTESHPHVVA